MSNREESRRKNGSDLISDKTKKKRPGSIVEDGMYNGSNSNLL